MALLVFLACGPGDAQTLPAPLRELPATPVAPSVGDVARRGVEEVGQLTGQLGERAAGLKRLLQRHRAVLDTDPLGAPVVRGEVVAIDPAAEALQRAREAGFDVAGERVLEDLGLRLVVLRAGPGQNTVQALRTLRALDPGGEYDFNHLYLGAAAGRGAAMAGVTQVAGTVGMTGANGMGSAPGHGLRVGLIDSGVAPGHPALAGADVHAWGCNGKPVPSAHGTAVASLLVGSGQGAPAGTMLYAADIYCGQPVGGAVTGYAEAMAWMARERVAVVNLSLVGPHNALLQRATRALLERGHILVAAVGNDGPSAPPLFPAAYPDVVGVTAVDQRPRALPEALRGQQVDFAAPGHNLRAARPDGRWGPVRGTSFAAPQVARQLALMASEPGAPARERAVAWLADRVVDLGEKGRDNTYGHGLLPVPDAGSPVSRP